MKFADIGKKLDEGVQKTKEKTQKVTKTIKDKVYEHEDNVKIKELEERINSFSMDLLSEILSEIETQGIEEYQQDNGYKNLLDNLEENTEAKNLIYKIKMFQYKKEATQKRLDKLTNDKEENKEE